MMREVRVNVSSPYNVHIGVGAADLLPDLISDKVNKVAIFHAPALSLAAKNLKLPDHVARFEFELPDAEAAKTVQVLQSAWDFLGQNGFTRSDLVISLGGGATTDVAGFIAATWLRGVQIVHIPTTLLAMVDAAVGGKTGINTASGKNLVGSFYHPLAVLCDLAMLESLPPAEIQQGLAEIIKCGFIADSEILNLLHGVSLSELNGSNQRLVDAAARAIKVKAEVVAEDFTESKVGGLGREILNYGHTLGHAIEKLENYQWRHGQAISVGMVFVAELAHQVGYLSQDDLKLHRDLLGGLGLPLTYKADKFDEILAAMAIDKKARGNTLRFVVLKGLQNPQILTAPTTEQLQAAYAAISEAE